MHKTSSSAAPADVRTRPLFSLLTAATVLGCLALALAGYIQPVVMGIVQGLGEFLPISSSAHLILIPWFFNWQGSTVDSLTFDVALHLGTLVALLGYFWRDWIALISALPSLLPRAAPNTPTRQIEARLLISILIATIPGAILGVLIEGVAERELRAPLLIAVALALVGVILAVVDRWRPQRRSITDMTWGAAFLIGVAQACALIPGVSRSGATMTMGRYLTFDREAAARYSFLLSAPITGAAVLFKFKDILALSGADVPIFAIGVLVSAAVGAIAIHFLLSYIRRAGFGIFAAYRILLALIIVVVALARG